MPGRNIVLHVADVHKSFGGLQALSDVDLQVEQGTVHAIIGPNGAGKSTLLNVCVGRIKPDRGHVIFDGETLDNHQPYEINQLGVARVFQTPEIFADLSLLDNVMIPAFAKRDGSFRFNALPAVAAQDDIRDEAETALLDVGLHERRHAKAGSLSRGDKRRLEMCMCLIQRPRLLLLDEPTAGMSRHDTNSTIDLLQEAEEPRHDQGDHRARHARGLLARRQDQRARPGPDHRRGYAGGGARRSEGQGSLSRGGAGVNARDVSAKAVERAGTDRDPYFSVRDIHAYYGESYIVQGVSFEVNRGEILSLLGRNGAGKTSTLRTLARVDSPTLRSGEIWLAGVPLHRMKAHQAARAGIQLVPEDRRIIGGLTVEENLILAQVAEPKGWSIERIYEHFPRLAERRAQDAVTMSGGEQQMLAVARALARDIKVLFLDEPYEGLAPVIVKEIERIVQQIRDLGITTIIVEQNAVAALRLSDRAVIMDTGSVVFSGSAREVLDNTELRHEYLAI